MAVAVSMPLHTNAPLHQLLAGSSVSSLSVTRLISVNSVNTKPPVSSLLTSTALGNELMDCSSGLPGLLPLERGQTGRAPQGPLPQRWVSKSFINIFSRITSFLFSACCTIKILVSSGLVSISFYRLCRHEIFVIPCVRGHACSTALDTPFIYIFYDSPWVIYISDILLQYFLLPLSLFLIFQSRIDA